METLETINKRASLKTRLSSREIEPEKIAKILDAARLAPSARNSQPWRFVVVQGREVVEALVSSVFFETNQVVKQAPVIIIACANPGDDVVIGGREYYLFDHMRRQPKRDWGDAPERDYRSSSIQTHGAVHAKCTKA
jgi:nitroreductase